MTSLPENLVGKSEAFEEQDYTPEKKKGISPFEYLNSINGPASKNMMRNGEDDEFAEKSYNAWVVNIGLSYFADTILHANLTNQYHALESRPQYEFLLNSIRPRKRFEKWVKYSGDEDLDAICVHYSCNRNVGKDYLSLLSSDQIAMIKKQQEKGGLEK